MRVIDEQVAKGRPFVDVVVEVQRLLMECNHSMSQLVERLQEEGMMGKRTRQKK